MQILVIDDHEELLNTTKEILEDVGHNCSTALDGEAALKLFQEDDFDLIITDVQMPRMGGIELITLIRRGDKHPNIPIMATSGNMNTYEAALKDIGATYTICKTDGDGLYRVIDEVSTALVAEGA